MMYDLIDRIVSLDMGQRGMTGLIEPARALVDEPVCAAAARPLSTLERGDTVIIEESSYGGMFGKLGRRGANIIGAPLDGDGIRIDALDQILSDLAAKGVTPKYVFTIPTVQNPTGSVMPVARREALLKLCASHGVPIFEDECYADLVWSGDRPASLRGSLDALVLGDPDDFDIDSGDYTWRDAQRVAVRNLFGSQATALHDACSGALDASDLLNLLVDDDYGILHVLKYRFVGNRRHLNQPLGK